METSNSPYNLELTTQRLEAFSDGVFAIAITLLIIEIKVPGHEELANTTLSKHLWHNWPKYFAYVFSFIIIGIYWANHHYLFKLFRRTDHWFNVLNILFLMTIAFLPFPTAVLGDYIMEDGHRQTAVAFYSAGILFPSFTWFLMWSYGSYRKRLIDPRLSESFTRYLTWLYIFSNVLYLAALAISFYNATAALCMNVLLTLLYLLPPKKPQFE